MAPWLELGPDGTEEGRLRERYGSLARRAVAQAVDPASPDFLNFTKDRQPLVDAAFLGQALLRAPKTLRDGLDDATKHHLIAALESSRVIVPNYNNWLLFTATVEAALKQLGAWWDPLRVDYAVRQHEQWYKGDGAYGDGADFHWDYYNSFVIHPMMLDVLDACADENPAWKSLVPRVQQRAQRYAAIQERLIAPDGSFPAFGRSLAYRFGAFHLLAQMALRHGLPDGVTPAQVRRSADGNHPSLHRGTGNIRCRRLAANRLLRPPAGRGRDVHLDRKLVSLFGRPAAIGPGGDRRLLVGRRPTLDSRARLVRPGVSDR